MRPLLCVSYFLRSNLLKGYRPLLFLNSLLQTFQDKVEELTPVQLKGKVIVLDHLVKFWTESESVDLLVDLIRHAQVRQRVWNTVFEWFKADPITHRE